MVLAAYYSAVETRIGNLFARFGRFVARHPVIVILVAITINGGLGVGIIKLKEKTDAENVYLPLGINRHYFSEAFS